MSYYKSTTKHSRIPTHAIKSVEHILVKTEFIEIYAFTCIFRHKL